MVGGADRGSGGGRPTARGGGWPVSEEYVRWIPPIFFLRVTTFFSPPPPFRPSALPTPPRRLPCLAKNPPARAHSPHPDLVQRDWVPQEPRRRRARGSQRTKKAALSRPLSRKPFRPSADSSAAISSSERFASSSTSRRASASLSAPHLRSSRSTAGPFTAARGTPPRRVPRQRPPTSATKPYHSKAVRYVARAGRAPWRPAGGTGGATGVAATPPPPPPPPPRPSSRTPAAAVPSPERPRSRARGPRSSATSTSTRGGGSRIVRRRARAGAPLPAALRGRRVARPGARSAARAPPPSVGRSFKVGEGRLEEGKGKKKKRESAFRKDGWEGGADFSLSLPLLALLALLALLLLRRKALWVGPDGWKASAATFASSSSALSPPPFPPQRTRALTAAGAGPSSPPSPHSSLRAADRPHQRCRRRR